MAKTRAQKEVVLQKIGDVFKNAETIAFVNFKGLNVLDTTALRGKLRAEGVEYIVAKKALVKKVLRDLSIAGDMPELAGEVALAYGAETAPARGIYEFAKGKEDRLSLSGGIFEGQYMSKHAIMELAAIPSLQVLRGMFVNVINSPIQRMAIVMNAIANVKN